MGKRIMLVLALTLSGCATLFKEPEWKFDCNWARLYDFQNNLRYRSMGVAPYSQFTKMYCESDPTSLEYYERRLSR